MTVIDGATSTAEGTPSVSARQRIATLVDSYSDVHLSGGRERLMQAVIGVTLEKGYIGLSMRSIAKAAKMQPASIYSHYENGKDQLVADTLLHAYLEFLRTVLKSALPSDAPAEDQFESLIRVHIAFQFRTGWSDLWEVLVVNESATDHIEPEDRAALETLQSAYVGFVGALLTELNSAGNVELKVRLIIDLLNQVTKESPLRTIAGDDETLIDAVVSACRAIAAS